MSVTRAVMLNTIIDTISLITINIYKIGAEGAEFFWDHVCIIWCQSSLTRRRSEKKTVFAPQARKKIRFFSNLFFLSYAFFKLFSFFFWWWVVVVELFSTANLDS